MLCDLFATQFEKKAAYINTTLYKTNRSSRSNSYNNPNSNSTDNNNGHKSDANNSNNNNSDEPLSSPRQHQQIPNTPPPSPSKTYYTSADKSSNATTITLLWKAEEDILALLKAIALHGCMNMNIGVQLLEDILVVSIPPTILLYQSFLLSSSCLLISL